MSKTVRIPVDEETRDILYEHKRASDSWDDTLLRLAFTVEPPNDFEEKRKRWRIENEQSSRTVEPIDLEELADGSGGTPNEDPNPRGPTGEDGTPPASTEGGRPLSLTEDEKDSGLGSANPFDPHRQTDSDVNAPIDDRDVDDEAVWDDYFENH